MSAVRVKLCGVRRPEDAILCAEAGADEVGVVFAPRSRRCITAATARDIRAALPAHLPLIGVFQDAALADALAMARSVGLAAVQFHGRLPAPGGALPLYAAVQIDGEPALAGLAALRGFRGVLLDGPAGGGGGVSFAWSLAHKARDRFDAEVFVAGGLTSDNVGEAIRAARPDGVDVSSGIEGSDGFKDAQRVRAFVHAARAAAAEL
ncbi:MAG TPA: phosphoribosylanthranilate isomerase [Myxococcales bacterium]|nr:phosphoribosylanthranilate isomerase [Myxococcales bacterium]